MLDSLKRNGRTAALTVLGASAILLAGCSDDVPEGRLVVHLSDAPFPFDLIRTTEVSIDSLAVRLAGSGSQDSGFFTVDRAPRTVDLLELRNGLTTTIGDAMVPAGEIDQVRVYVGVASLTLTDDRTFDLTFPSGSSSGVKIFPSPPIQIAADQTVEALIDFDLGQSFSSIPSSPRRDTDITGFKFHPVLRVANLEDVGAISGTVWSDAGTPADPSDDSPIAAATVTADQSGNEITSTFTDGNGRYVILGLAPGTYTVTAVVSEGFSPGTTSAVSEAARETGSVDLVLSPTTGSP